MLKPGFLITAPPGQRKAVVDVAQELEHRGFSHIFCPHDTTPAVLHGVAAPYDSLSLCTAMIQATNRIKVGSGVAITYTRHPAEMAAAAAFNHEISGGRFYLGLGPSHDIILKHFNIESEKPLGHMRSYVAQVRAAAAGQPMPPIILGALRRKMVPSGRRNCRWSARCQLGPVTCAGVAERDPKGKTGHVPHGPYCPRLDLRGSTRRSLCFPTVDRLRDDDGELRPILP